MPKVSTHTHEILLSAAKTLISSKGAAATSLAQIYRAAGVSKATTYRDVEFITWWNEQIKADQTSKFNEREDEVRKLRKDYNLQSGIVNVLQEENRLARTVIAAQAAHILRLSGKRGENVQSALYLAD